MEPMEPMEPTEVERAVVDAVVMMPADNDDVEQVEKENCEEEQQEQQPTTIVKTTRNKKTPSRPLCAADIAAFSPAPAAPVSTAAEDEQETAFSAIEQEKMDEEEDKENVVVPADADVVAVPVAAPRAAPAPQIKVAAPRTSSLYAPTKCMKEKQRHRADTNPAATTAAAAAATKPRGPTVPVAPTFRTDARSAMHGGGARPLTSEERELQEVAAARQALEEQRRRRVQHKPKKAFQIKKAAPKLTVPAAPVSHLARRLGEKAPAAAAEPKANGATAAGATAADFVNRKPTQPEPFTFATDARLKAPHPAAAAAEAAPTVAEAAERFMRDPRSHGAPPHVPGRRTEAHPPKLRTDLRAKTDYRPKVRDGDGDDDEAQSFVPSSSHLSHH